MPIDKAEEAVNTAERFLAKYHAFRTLKRVVRQGDKWVVEFDIGLLSPQIIRVTLDLSGSVIEYGEVAGSGN